MVPSLLLLFYMHDNVSSSLWFCVCFYLALEWWTMSIFVLIWTYANIVWKLHNNSLMRSTLQLTKETYLSWIIWYFCRINSTIVFAEKTVISIYHYNIHSYNSIIFTSGKHSQHNISYFLFYCKCGLLQLSSKLEST